METALHAPPQHQATYKECWRPFVDNRKLRLFFACSILFLEFLYGLDLSVCRRDQLIWLPYFIGQGFLISSLCAVDSEIRGRPFPLSLRSLVFLTWQYSGPIWLLWRFGLRRIHISLLLLLAVLACLLSGACISFLIVCLNK